MSSNNTATFTLTAFQLTHLDGILEMVLDVTDDAEDSGRIVAVRSALVAGENTLSHAAAVWLLHWTNSGLEVELDAAGEIEIDAEEGDPSYAIVGALYVLIRDLRRALKGK